MTKSISFQPLVTIYIPTYNRVKLLQRAVDSVLNQSYKNIEIIVVDDNSTDDTHEYLARMSEEDSRFKYFINEENSGACMSRNKAILAANGQFITGLDDDDYFHSDRIQVFVNEAIRNDECAYFTTYNVKTSDSTIVKPSLLTIFKRNKITNPNLLLRRNYLGNQIFVKTDYLQSSGGFDLNLKAWQDLECWYNLLKSQNIEAKFIKKATQTIDISHEHERISTQKTNNIIHSYNYFVNKHNLNYFEKIILENQLIRYIPNKYPKSKKILLFLLTGNRHLIKNL